jgi:hypothetical protein
MASLYVFPKEILEQIFLQCDLKTVGTCIRVCKKFLNVTQNQSFWLVIFSRFGNLREVKKERVCDADDNAYEDWQKIRDLIQRYVITKKIIPSDDVLELDLNMAISTIPKRIFKGPLYIEGNGKTNDTYQHLFLLQKYFTNLNQLIGIKSINVRLNDDNCCFYDAMFGIIRDATYCRQQKHYGKVESPVITEMSSRSLYTVDSIVISSFQITFKLTRVLITMDLARFLKTTKPYTDLIKDKYNKDL